MLSQRVSKRLKKCFRIGDGRLCLTPTQQAHLQPIELLGEGGSAAVFSRPDSEAVKFTVDASDVSALLKVQETGAVPKIRAAYRLPQTVRSIDWQGTSEERRVPVYALVLEKLKELPSTHPGTPAIRAARRLQLAGKKITSEAVMKACHRNERCKQFGRELLSTLRQFETLGVVPTDLHEQNFGIDNEGRWKILDLGETQDQNVGPLQMLEGQRRK